MSRLGAAVVCLAAIAMAACRSETPTPSAQPSSTLPSASPTSLSRALPTLPPGQGPCGGKTPQGAVVQVDPADPTHWWVEHDQGRIDLVWPVGATTDGSSVRDGQGAVLATGGDAVEFVCDLPDGDPRAFLP